MKFLLIGHSILDHIEKYEDKNLQPGGIFYSVLGMLSLIKENDSVYLLTAMDQAYQDIFSVTYNNVNLSFSSKTKSMPEVILKISQQSEREETYKNISEALDLNQLNNFETPNGILINMITGFDITSEQLKWLRDKFSCPIYFDVHTLSRGLDDKMNRTFRTIPKVKDWLSSIDILQCNETELNSICSLQPIERAIAFILSSGVKLILVTKAEKGSEAYFNHDNNLHKYSIPAEKVEVKNKIGCGDIFGAVFFYSYISKQDVFTSLILANKASAIAAATENLTTYSKIILK